MVMSQPYLHVDYRPKGDQAREETRPLLSSTASGSASAYPQPHSSPPAYSSISSAPVIQHQIHHHYHFNGRRTRSQSCTFCKTFFTTIFLVLCILVILLIPLIGSYIAQLSVLDRDLERVMKEHVVFSGPDSVQVVNVTNWGVWVNVEGKIGVDAASVIGVNRVGYPDDHVEPEWKTLWKAVGRWGIERIDKVNVRLEGIEVWGVYRELAGVDATNQGKFFNVIVPPMDVPVSAERTGNENWLTSFSTPLFIQPSLGRHVSEILSVDHKTRSVDIQVRVQVAKIRYRGYGDGTKSPLGEAWCNAVGWISEMSEKTLRDVKVGTSVRLPSIPGFPDLQMKQSN